MHKKNNKSNKNSKNFLLEQEIEDLISPDDVAKIIAFMASEDAKELKGTVFTN